MRLRQELIRHTAVTIMSFAVVGVFVITVLNISFLNPLARAIDSFSTVDIYYQMMIDAPNENTDISIIDITAVESRRDIAAVVNKVESLHPKTVGIDIVFLNPKEDVLGDNMIAEIAEKYDNIVFAANYQFDGVRHSYLKNRSFFTPYIDVKEGITNFNRELYSDIKRNMNIGVNIDDSICPSFAWLTASVSSDGIMPLREGTEEIDFTPTRFQIINADSVNGKADIIKDRIVLIGAIGDDTDKHYTPLGKIPGIELQAYSIQTLLQKTNTRSMPIAAVAVLSFLVVLLTAWLQERYGQATDRIRNTIIRQLLSADMALCIFTFVWMIVLLYLSTILFALTRISINIGWAFSAIALLNTTRKFYNISINTIRKRP